MALLLQESLADATGIEQHDDFLQNFSPHALQAYYDSMEHGAEDSYNRTWSGMDLLASAYSPTESDPEAPSPCLQSIDNNPQLSQEQNVLLSHHNTYFDDYNVHRILGEQDPSEARQALDSSVSTCSGIELISQPVNKSVNVSPSDYPFPWDGSLFYPPGRIISLSAKHITDDRAPDMTDCSTPTSSSICQNKPSSVETSTNDFKTDNQRWHATQSRLRAADQSFLYGVLTTKIFCRPSCASRRPSRRHVRFFPFPGAIEAASQANFRPCKRCNPELLGTTNTSVLGISHVLRHIIVEANNRNSTKPKNAFKLETLAQSAGLSPFHFHRLFKATTQITPGDFISACRTLALQDALGKDSDDGNTTSKTVAQISSITNSLSFTPRTARKALGTLSPVSYAKGAPFTTIKYSSVATPCRRICIAFSNPNPNPHTNPCSESLSQIKIHAVLIGPDSERRVRLRFPDSMVSDVGQSGAFDFEDCVRRLEEEVRDRDTEVGDDVLGALWRARVWLRLGEFGG